MTQRSETIGPRRQAASPRPNCAPGALTPAICLAALLLAALPKITAAQPPSLPIPQPAAARDSTPLPLESPAIPPQAHVDETARRKQNPAPAAPIRESD